jgi:hypothetical protein
MAKATSTDVGSLIRTFIVVGAALGAIGLMLTLLHQLLPFLQILLPLFVAWWFWQRQRKVQTRQQSRLHDVFYRLLQTHDGRITLLDFAMTASIPAIAARQYLDHRAKEFAARFEVTDHGDVVYVFSSLQWSRSTSASTTPLKPIPLRPRPLNSTETSTDEAIAHDNAASDTLPASLTQAELAKRLGVTAKTISRKKHSPLLSDWTQTRDPDGTSWSYVAQTQRFVPMSDRPSIQESVQEEKAL